MAGRRYFAVHHDGLDHWQTRGAINVLGAFLVHRQRRGQDAGMRIGNAHQFQQALHRAVLAEAAMQSIEDSIGVGAKQLIAGIVTGIHHHRIEAFFRQSLHHAAPGGQRDVAFGGASTHQHGDAVEAHAASPTRLISHSSSTPDFSRTRLRTSSPNASISAAFASPRLIRKFACFSLTWASPILRPRQPA